MFVCCRGPSPIEENGKLNSSTGEEADELMSAPSLMSINNNINESKMVKRADSSAVDELLNGLATSVQSGTISVTSSLKTGAASAANSLEDMQNFLSSLFTTPSKTVHVPSSANSNLSDGGSIQTEASDSIKKGGIAHVEYKKYALKGYVQIPEVMKPFMDALSLDHYVICSLPTMAPSVGLAGHRDTVPKAIRSAAPFFIVVDEPGKLADYHDDRYLWVELKLGDVFRLDISKMSKMEDYVKTLSKKAKWNFKDRQKKFNNPALIFSEVVPIKPGDKAFLDTLWPLYKQTGEKNGFTVLSEEEFYSFHTEVSDLVAMLVWDVRDPANKRLVSFCTGVSWRDVLMPMWCGTDYSNELNRTCSTYFNMLYNYVRIAIEDPKFNWVDLGASRRTAKMAIGFNPYPSSGYFRCKNSVMQALVEYMMGVYFHPEELINDP
jgi:hypothetical protein